MYPLAVSAQSKRAIGHAVARAESPSAADDYAASYSYSRLCFKADVIEPLAMDDRFCVMTKVGTFAFTKREFYATFPGVVESDSYRLRRIYHFPQPPNRALQFKIGVE